MTDTSIALHNYTNILYPITSVLKDPGSLWESPAYLAQSQGEVVAEVKGV